MEYLVRQIAGAIATATPRERIEGAVLAFLCYVRNHADGFAVLTHDSPVTHAGGAKK